MTIVEKSETFEPRFGEALKFERADWSLFRTVEGLQQRAGVPKRLLRRLVVKELVDNGLDNGGDVKIETLPDNGYAIVDDGPGIDPDEVPRLFNIARPMMSTKLLRLPSRGALGNGLRVVAGAVLASDGSLDGHDSQPPDRTAPGTRRHDHGACHGDGRLPGRDPRRDLVGTGVAGRPQ